MSGCISNITVNDSAEPLLSPTWSHGPSHCACHWAARHRSPGRAPHTSPGASPHPGLAPSRSRTGTALLPLGLSLSTTKAPLCSKTELASQEMFSKQGSKTVSREPTAAGGPAWPDGVEGGGGSCPGPGLGLGGSSRVRRWPGSAPTCPGAGGRSQQADGKGSK